MLKKAVKLDLISPRQNRPALWILPFHGPQQEKFNRFRCLTTPPAPLLKQEGGVTHPISFLKSHCGNTTGDKNYFPGGLVYSKFVLRVEIVPPPSQEGVRGW